MIEKPHAPATKRNRDPICEVLKEYLVDPDMTIFEIGSGTGEHCIYFAQKFPHCRWIASDIKENHQGIAAWIAESGLSNVEGPEHFEVGQNKFSRDDANVVFTANTFHIMYWPTVEQTIDLIGSDLKKNAYFKVYGPFNYNGNFTSDSNRAFDQSLKARDPEMGIRDFEEVDFLMQKAGLRLIKDHEMPANNRMLVYQKI